MKKQNILFAFVALAISFTACNNISTKDDKAPKLKTELDSLNYSLGLDYGNRLKTSALTGDSVDQKIESFINGVKAGMAGKADKNPDIARLGKNVGQWLNFQKTKGLMGDST